MRLCNDLCKMFHTCTEKDRVKCFLDSVGFALKDGADFDCGRDFSTREHNIINSVLSFIEKRVDTYYE